MMRVARYSPRENGGQVQVWRQVRRPTRWRIEIRAHLAGQEPEARVIRLQDRMLLSEVTDVAMEAIREMVPAGGPVEVEDAHMDFWAEV